MKKEEFKNWLEQKGYKKKVVSSRIANASKVNKSYDLDNYYQNERTEELLEFFSYSKKDQQDGLEPIANIKIDGDYYTGFASLKQAIKLYFNFLDETKIVSKQKTRKESPVFEGDFEDFNRYVGPKLRNIIQVLTMQDKKKINSICEFCKEPAVLQAAHRTGEERPQIIEKILEQYFKVRTGWYRVNLDEFEEKFKEAHTPIKDHIFFLCADCHNKYDKKGLITTKQLEDKRNHLI